MSNLYRVHGTIKAIYPQETITTAAGKTFTEQYLLLDAAERNEQTGQVYPNDLKLKFVNFKSGDLTQRFAVGNDISVTFALKGFSYMSKKTGQQEYGIDVRCFSILTIYEGTPQATAPQAPQQAPAQQPAPQIPAPTAPAPQDIDQLPF